jgi:hypothetical protein
VTAVAPPSAGGIDLDPLVEIEQRVQARAKDLALDMADDRGETGLRRLIADEIERWSDAAKRGDRPFDLADPDRVAERAFRNVAGYGPLTPLLEDPDVWEIMINAPEGAFRLIGPTRWRTTTNRDFRSTRGHDGPHRVVLNPGTTDTSPRPAGPHGATGGVV